MSNNVGGLIVTLGLNAVEYFAGLTKAEYQTQQSVRAVNAHFESISGAAAKLGTQLGAALGAGLSAHVFVEMVRGAFDAQEELGNLGKRAGITGSELSSLTTDAKLTHTALEDVAGMSAKLSKALLDFGKESAQSTIVLKALGLSAKDVPELLAKPADAVLKFAKLLDSLPEGGTKAAVQLLIIGKAGGTTAAFLSDLAKQTSLVKTRTDEEIESAKAFNDSLVLLGIRSDDLKTKFANALLPTLDAIVTAFTSLSTAGGGAAGKLEQLKNSGDIQEWARNGAIAVGTLAESLVAVGRLALAVGGSFKVVAADVDVLLAKTNAPSQKITGSFGFSPEEATKGESEYVAAKKRRDAIVKAADQNYADLVEKNGAFITDAIKKSFEMQDRATQAGIDAASNSDRNDRLNATNNAKAAAAEAAKKKAREAKTQNALNAVNARVGGADDPARKILEGQIRALEASIAREKDILGARASYLRDYYQEGYLSVAQYYDQLQQARDENLRSTTATLDREIALQEAYKAKALKATDKQDAQNKIDDIREKQSTLIRQAGFEEEALGRDRTRATEQYGDQLSELNAKMLELAGNTAAAANIRFDVQNKLLSRQVTPRVDDTDAEAKIKDRAQAQLASIKAQQNIQAQLNDKNREYQLILNAVGIAQERINIAQQSGAIGEIEALTRTSELARANIGRLTAMADAMEAVARKAKDLNADGTINIVKLEQLQQVEQLRLGIERLAAQTDLLKDKFNNIFSSSFSEAIQSLANGTKSFKEAAKDLGKSIAGSINKLAADELATKLFGKEGPLSGIGGIFSKLFGGTAKDASTTAAATALTTSATTLTASGTSLTAAGVALDSAAAALSAAAAAMSAGGAAGGAGGLLGAFGGAGAGQGYGTIGSNIPPGPYPYAFGTQSARGGLSLVGEHGPELIDLPRGARVTPINKYQRSERSISIVQHINVMPGAPTASVRQAKAQLRDATMSAVRDR